MSGTILSIVNQKGGVGKTTTAINLASYLSENNNKVLLVDMDPQANATSGIGVRQDQIHQTIYNLLIENAELKDALFPTPFDNLHLLPSSKDLAGAEVELVGMSKRDQQLKRILTPLKEYYDFIVIDCPPSLGLLTLNSLVASDKVIVPVQCEYFALEGIAGLINTLNLVKNSLNPRLEVAGIVLTMYDRRTSLNQQVVEETKRYFKDLVFHTVVPRNIRLTEAPSHGLPIALYNPNSTGAQAYNELAKEVLNRVKSHTKTTV